MVKFPNEARETNGSSTVLSVLGEVFAVAYGCYCASRTLHHDLVAAIVRAPMSFFDTTPIGIDCFLT